MKKSSICLADIDDKYLDIDDKDFDIFYRKTYGRLVEGEVWCGTKLARQRFFLALCLSPPTIFIEEQNGREGSSTKIVGGENRMQGPNNHAIQEIGAWMIALFKLYSY